MIPAFYNAGKNQSKPNDQKSASESVAKSSSATKVDQKSEVSLPIAIPTEHPIIKNQTADKTDAKKTKKVQQKETTTSTSPAHGLATLKSLIAKAAAGTLSSKSSSSKIYGDVVTKSEDKDEYSKPSPPKSPIDVRGKELKGSPPGKAKTKTSSTTSTSTTNTSTSVVANSNEDVGVQENDYWLEEKLKMQNTLAYQSFQKGAMLKKNLTSKGTSPPPQTISTQVQYFPF